MGGELPVVVTIDVALDVLHGGGRRVTKRDGGREEHLQGAERLDGCRRPHSCAQGVEGPKSWAVTKSRQRSQALGFGVEIDRGKLIGWTVVKSHGVPHIGVKPGFATVDEEKFAVANITKIVETGVVPHGDPPYRYWHYLCQIITSAQIESSTTTFSTMTNTVTALLDQALEGRRLLDHPFYRRWEAGALHEGELQHYAEQYRYFEAHLPLFLAELAGRLPEGPAQAAVNANLRDEVAPPTHLDLFESFARFYGATNAEISPAMQTLIDEYRDVLATSDVAAIAGLLAYEAQGAAIADTKAEGLRVHYGANDSATNFWDVHGSVEADHAAWTMDALASLGGDDAAIVAAARRIADAWWNFLSERDELIAA